MIKYNTISFDAAATLFFIKEGLGEAYLKILKKYTNEYKSTEISKVFKKHFNAKKGLHFDSLTGDNLIKAEKDWWYFLVKDIFIELGMFKSFDEYFDELYDYFSCDAWEIYPDTLPALKNLKKKGYKIIITSNFDSRIYKVCDKLSITENIDHFTISSESGFSKPNKEIFYRSLQKVNASPEESMHVGDNYNLDYLPSLEIGMKPLLIVRDNKLNNNLEATTINSLNNIKGYLDEH